MSSAALKMPNKHRLQTTVSARLRHKLDEVIGETKSKEQEVVRDALETFFVGYDLARDGNVVSMKGSTGIEKVIDNDTYYSAAQRKGVEAYRAESTNIDRQSTLNVKT